MTKDISIDQIIETIKGKIPQSGVIASILSAAMGAALAIKILEALKLPAAKELTKHCSTLQGISKFSNKELAVSDLLIMAKASLASLQIIETAMNGTPAALRAELLVGAMCCWTGLEGTISMAESKLRLNDTPDNEKHQAELSTLREAGKKSGKAAEAIAKRKTN